MNIYIFLIYISFLQYMFGLHKHYSVRINIEFEFKHESLLNHKMYL